MKTYGLDVHMVIELLSEFSDKGSMTTSSVDSGNDFLYLQIFCNVFFTIS